MTDNPTYHHHRLDPLEPDARQRVDQVKIEDFRLIGAYGELWIEQQYMGEWQGTYRSGSFAFSGRYRLVGYVLPTTAYGKATKSGKKTIAAIDTEFSEDDGGWYATGTLYELIQPGSTRRTKEVINKNPCGDIYALRESCGINATKQEAISEIADHANRYWPKARIVILD